MGRGMSRGPARVVGTARTPARALEVQAVRMRRRHHVGRRTGGEAHLRRRRREPWVDATARRVSEAGLVRDATRGVEAAVAQVTTAVAVTACPSRPCRPLAMPSSRALLASSSTATAARTRRRALKLPRGRTPPSVAFVAVAVCIASLDCPRCCWNCCVPGTNSVGRATTGTGTGRRLGADTLTVVTAAATVDAALQPSPPVPLSVAVFVARHW